jgi:hypothetical protein
MEVGKQDVMVLLPALHWAGDALISRQAAELACLGAGDRPIAHLISSGQVVGGHLLPPLRLCREKRLSVVQCPSLAGRTALA